MSIKRIVKPAVILTLTAFILSTAGFGQTRKHDLSLSFGLLSNDQVLDIFEDLILITLTLGNFYKDDMKFSGVPFLTYHYSGNSRFGFGLAVGGYASSGGLVREGGDLVVGDFKENNYVGAVELDYRWVMRPGLQIYSGAGFGVRVRRGEYTDEDETDIVTKVLPTFHLNALGLRWGRDIGVFAELGYGYKGVLVAGINAQF